MKTLKEYIFASYINSENLLDESLYDDNLPIDEGILSKIANFLGNTAHKVNSVWHDIKHFPKNVKLSYKGMTANLVNKEDSLPEEERSKIAERVSNKKVGSEQIKEIKSIFTEYSNNDNAKKSGFMCYLALYGKTLAENEKDSNNVKYFDSKLSEVPSKTKEIAKNIFMKIRDKVMGNDSDNEEESSQQSDNGTEQGNQKPEEIVKKTVEKPEIKKVAEPANIDTKELADYICQIIIPSDDDYNIIQDQAVALAEIICGAATLQNNEKIKKDILAKYGIKDIDEFINKIKSEKKK